ncbi:hypothetical protein CGRA01v4_13966 [Colletotrichum graminicola]|nr:hypothetical protein CGRA01v4_13966 [Colletotrichum graminicola]
MLGESAAGPEANQVHKIGTILLAASHVLKFSPTSPLPDGVNVSADPSAYGHRFQPSTDGKAVAGYTMEDWCRAINIVLIFCYRRTGRTLIASETAPQHKAVTQVIYVPEDDDTGYIGEAEARNSTESMLNRALFKLAPEQNKVRKKLAMLALSQTKIGAVDHVARHEKIISAIQGSTNLTDVIASRCHEQGIHSPVKVDDETMRLLLDVLCDRVEINRHTKSFDAIAPTFSEISPDYNPQHFQDFLEIGCADLHLQVQAARSEPADSQARKEADIAINRAFETWLINSTVSAECPAEDADDLEHISRLQGYTDWRNCAPSSRRPDYKLFPHQVIGKYFPLRPAFRKV